jgi:hypothetical protein
MKALDPQLRLRLAEWQAYHMSNYDFMWPWAKWSQVLTAGAADPQRYGVFPSLPAASLEQLMLPGHALCDIASCK